MKMLMGKPAGRIGCIIDWTRCKGKIWEQLSRVWRWRWRGINFSTGPSEFFVSPQPHIPAAPAPPQRLPLSSQLRRKWSKRLGCGKAATVWYPAIFLVEEGMICCTVAHIRATFLKLTLSVPPSSTVEKMGARSEQKSPSDPPSPFYNPVGQLQP